MQHNYRCDLAHIHDVGFGHLATSATSVVIDELMRAHSNSGTVVNLGCGSGIEARLLCDVGYEVVGIDISEPLINIARKRVPEATFRIDSFVTADIPPCIAVTAIGEVFNYAFDTANNAANRATIFQRIFAALAPGGLLVFDMAGYARAPLHSQQRTFTEGSDWAVLMETEADTTNNLLTRHITTFRMLGELYRRDSEVHQLQLVEPEEVRDALSNVGFSVQVLDCYGSLPLPQGLIGFFAKKPGGVSAQQNAPADSAIASPLS